MKRFQILVLVSSLLTCGMLVAAHAPAGKLDRAGERTRGASDNSSSSSRSDDEDDDDGDADDGHDDDADGNDCGQLCRELLYWMFAAPWTVPYEVLREEPDPVFAYARHPFQGGRGYLRPWRGGVELGASGEPLDPPTWPASLPEGSRHWAALTQVELGTDLSAVHRGFALLRVMMPIPVELEARFLYLTEHDAMGAQDWATISNLSLNWRFAESESVMFRTGLGYQHWFEDAGEPSDPLTEDERTSSGMDFHYGFDAFIAQPVVLSAEVRAGFVGTAFTWQLRATLGAALGPVEVYAGYHGLAVGGVSLGGPLAGLRGWW